MSPHLTLLTGVLAPPAAYVAGAVADSGFDWQTFIGTTITPVIVVILLLFGKLHTDGDYRRLEAYAKSEHDERVKLQNVLTEDVLPKLHRATLIMEALLPLVEAEVRLRQAREINPPGS